MKKKILLILTVVIIVAVAAAGIFAYRMYQKYGLGVVPFEDMTDSIPEVSGELPPLTYGSSDWLHWRGPGLEGKSTMTGIIRDWSKGLEKVWEAGYLCSGEESVAWSGPVIQGNRLVVMGRNETQDLVFCLHATTGKLLWKREYDAPTDSKFGSGPRATPCIEGNLAFTFGRAGDLICWNLYDGTLIWQKNVIAEGGKMPNWGCSSSPLLLGKKVIVQGGGEAGLIAFDKKTGDVIWKSPAREAGYATAMPVELEGKTHLLNFHGTGLALVDTLDGNVFWDIPWETEYGVNAATPVVKDDMVFITSGYKMGSQCLKISEQEAVVIWKSDVISSQVSDLVLLDGYLYGYTANANNSGPFKCVRFSTGEEMWSTKKIGGGSVVLVDGLLICFDVKGNLHLVNPNPVTFEKTGELMDAVTRVSHESWTPPAPANGKIYLRYLNKLVCYDLKP